MAELIITDRRGGSDEPLQVIQQIASASPDKCYKFARKLLLSDDRVKELRMQVRNHEEFVPLVLNDWLERGDDDTTAISRTWGALAQCVQSAGMDRRLAHAIRNNDPSGEYRLITHQQV